MFYSKATGGFYSSEIHGEKMPDDVMEITATHHSELLLGQSRGKVIACASDGVPYLQEVPSPNFNQALSVINTEYQKDVDAFNKSFSLAIMFDGPTEESKKANIRSQYAARKAKYTSDLVALRTQYGM